MNWMIDGHNLIGKLPGWSLASLDDEMRLIEVLQVFCRMERATVDVYFDGSPSGYAGTRSHGQVKAHFIRRGRTADDAITTRLHKLGKSASNWAVVSSDRRVQAEARACRAAVIPSQEFAARLALAQQKAQTTDRESEKTLSAEEVADWEELFRKHSN